MRIAIDTGGTFTDCVYLHNGDIEVLKVFSTPADPSIAVLDAIAHAVVQILPRDDSAKNGLSSPKLEMVHGTTVGTNTMLQRTGATVAFMTTSGFEDTIAIGRQTRSKLYDWFAPEPVCLISPTLRFGVPERVSAEGEILRSPSDEELRNLVEAVRASGAESIAISLLFSFLRPESELRVESALKNLNIPISTSHRILPEFREYERASATVVNAYLAPKMQSYLVHLEQEVLKRHGGGTVHVMQSSGGIIPAQLAAQEPVRTVLSGPAGGVIGASKVAAWAGYERIIGFDMGGTSTDVFLSDTATGGTQLTRESLVDGIPIGIPMLDIHTAGAGGGSIARFDAGGLLRIGPESAGADPGPICFGHGTSPTVTDANLILGRLDAASFLGGSVSLDRQRTLELMHRHKGPIASVEEYAAGILRVVEAQMEKAIRVISIERGHDPRQFTLVAYGGGGPLHACSLARSLRIPTVLIPANPGALSAVGILLADSVRDYSLTVMLPKNRIDELSGSFAQLFDRASDSHESISETISQYSADIRYRGQGHELNVAFDLENLAESLAAFHRLHQRLYGFSDPQKEIEIVNLRLRMRTRAKSYTPRFQTPADRLSSPAFYAHRNVYFEDQFMVTNLYHRHSLEPGNGIEGPAIITEYSSGTVVPPGSIAEIDGFGNIVIRVGDNGSIEHVV